MFDYGDLDALAKEAKGKLKNQEDTSAEIVDLYDEFEDINKEFDLRNTLNDDEISDLELNESLYKEEGASDDIHLDKFDDVLFPGGPSKSDIEMWKKDWVGYNIYVTEIAEHAFVFRTLNRFEYKQLIALQNCDALQREEIICKTVTLFPKNYSWKEMSTTLAGIPSTYSEIIMEKSGFTKDFAIQVL